MHSSRPWGHLSDLPHRLRTALEGSYRLEREVGAGGMATVYLAHDLKHDRKVAIKVLRPELAAVIGAERFLSEIKTTAHLQHPHILGLIDSGDADSFLYYVMPFIEGESLRDRLVREKQLPIDEAVRIACEVASALDYAHRHDVIHRDIKPENILLHDGSALVADFGIALAASKAGGTRMTETGMSLGTPHYMSPEQAMGEREITARSDVYALGCVLYEMLVGEPPFTGPTAQSIVAKVMTDDPRAPHDLRRTVPQPVEEAVLTALEKLPADRFGSAAEFAAALQGRSVSQTGSRGYAVRPAAPPPRVLIGALAVALAVAAWGWLRPGSRSIAVPPSRLAIVNPDIGGSGGSVLSRQLALSPDGGTVYYVALSATGAVQLMRQPLAAEAPTPIDGTEEFTNPLPSPDGRWLIAEGMSQTAFRIPATGGTPIALPAELRSTDLAVWGKGETLWFSPGTGRGIARMAPSDSVSIELVEESKGLQLQQVLPDGRTALVVNNLGAASGPVLLFDLETGKRTPLLERLVVEVRYAAGYLIWVLPDGTLQAQAFDPKHPELTGQGRTIATGISITGTGIAQIAVSPIGTVAYIPEEPRSLMFVDRSGSARPATAERRNFHAPEYSPDGRRLSTDFNTADGRDVWILSLDQGTMSRATFERDGHDATWTPDGQYITYSSARSGEIGIYRKRPGSAEQAESLFASPNLTYTGHWLRDGSGLVTAGTNLQGASRTDVGLVENGGRGPLSPLVASPFNDQYAMVSPDGRWLAFVSDQSGTDQVYLRPLSGDGDQLQVSFTGGTEPVWAPNGQELFYRGSENGEPVLMAAAIRTMPQPTVTGRKTLFSIAEYVGTTPHANYAVSPDGRTFAMVRRSRATRIVIIQNLPGLVRQVEGATEPAR